jgi:hypothetical protein
MKQQSMLINSKKCSGATISVVHYLPLLREALRHRCHASHRVVSIEPLGSTNLGENTGDRSAISSLLLPQMMDQVAQYSAPLQY